MESDQEEVLRGTDIAVSTEPVEVLGVDRLSPAKLLDHQALDFVPIGDWGPTKEGISFLRESDTLAFQPIIPHQARRNSLGSAPAPSPLSEERVEDLLQSTRKSTSDYE